MSLEVTDNEFRARVKDESEFEWIKQIWPAKKGSPNYPYNKTGVRATGGKFKSEDSTTEHSIRFSRKTKFKWTEKKVRGWLTKNGYEVKILDVVKVKAKEVDQFEGRSKDQMVWVKFDLTPRYKAAGDKNPTMKDFQEGEDLYITGIISSDSVDVYEEIVAPEAIMESLTDFMKFPTFRLMHMSDAIGKVLKIWRDGKKVLMEARIDGMNIDTIKKVLKGTLAAFSIGFLVKKMEQYCPNKDEQGNLKCYWKFTKIMLVEVSLVDSPANRDAAAQTFNYKSLNQALKDAWVKPEEDLGYKATLIGSDGVEPPSTFQQVQAKAEDVVEDPENEPIDVTNTNTADEDCEVCKVVIRAAPEIVYEPEDEEVIETVFDSDDDEDEEDEIKTIPVQEPEQSKFDKKEVAVLLSKIRGIPMPKKNVELEGGEEPTGIDIPVGEPAPVPAVIPEPEPVEEPTDAEKILAGIKELSTKVDANAVEIKRMEMEEEEKATFDREQEAIKAATATKDAEIIALKSEMEELRFTQKVADEVDARLAAIPPQRKSFGPESQPEGSGLSGPPNRAKVSAADEQAAQVLRRAASKGGRSARTYKQPGTAVPGVAAAQAALQEKATFDGSTGYGAEMLPTETSDEIIQIVYDNLWCRQVFRSVPMTNETQKIPKLSGSILMQGTTGNKNTAATESRHTTVDVSLTLKTLIGNVPIDRKTIAYAVATLMDGLKQDIADKVMEYEENCFINGDTRAAATNLNGEYDATNYPLGIVSRDPRLEFNGLRRFAQLGGNSVNASGAALTRSHLLKAFATLGNYANNKDNLIVLCSKSVETIILAWDEVKTLKDYGPGATVFTGEVGKLYGATVIASSLVNDLMSESGSARTQAGGTSGNRTIVLVFDRRQPMIGDPTMPDRQFTVEIDPEPKEDEITLIPSEDLAFNTRYNESICQIINVLPGTQ